MKIPFHPQKARIINMEERAKEIRFEPICNVVFMHGSNDHQGECSKRHKIVSTDILDDEINQIKPGILRFHVLDINSPTEYIVRPSSWQTEEKKWIPINGFDEFIYLDLKMQAFYRDNANSKSLITLKLGEKCMIEKHDKFYRAEIIKIYPKR